MSPYYRLFIITLLTLTVASATWMFALFGTPVDAFQGDVYRIIYIHVPSAFCAFTCSAGLLVTGVLGLVRKDARSLLWSQSLAEVGLLFTVLTLITGSIWGKPTWGTWWTWDARITTTFILGLLYAAFLILASNIKDIVTRLRACSVLAILIAIDVPVVYKSVQWWRTLHQPQTLLREGGSTIDPTMKMALLLCIASSLAVCVMFVFLRKKIYELQAEVEEAAISNMAET